MTDDDQPIPLGQGGYDRAIQSILSGMAWIALVLIMEHSGPIYLTEGLLEWAAQLLGGTLIIAGIIETIMAS